MTQDDWRREHPKWTAPAPAPPPKPRIDRAAAERAVRDLPCCELPR
jgi:hypothetical protein